MIEKPPRKIVILLTGVASFWMKTRNAIKKGNKIRKLTKFGIAKVLRPFHTIFHDPS
jgi:hypothetical protein